MLHLSGLEHFILHDCNLINSTTVLSWIVRRIFHRVFKNATPLPPKVRFT